MRSKKICSELKTVSKTRFEITGVSDVTNYLKDTSYDVGKIREALPERYRKYLIFLHSFSGCDTVSAISGFSKPTLLTKLCKTDKAEGAMDVFNDIRAKKSDIIKAGCELFKLTFYGNPPEDLEDLWMETRRTRLCTSPYNRSHCTALPSEVCQLQLCRGL